MRRRDLMAGLGAIAAGRAPASRAQQTERLRRVGVLIAFAETDPIAQAETVAFAQALGRFGWVEGKNIRIDYRFAAGNPTLFPTYATELIGRSPDVILASTPPGVAAIKRQTQTIPVVFVFVIDPIGLGLVRSLARPGGNITGFGSFDPP